MTIKEIAIETIERLPEDVTWEDVQDRINFVAAIRKGIRSIENGEVVPHEEIEKELAEWLAE